MSREAEFYEVLNDNKKAIMRLCIAYATDPDQVKDLFQEVALNIWKSLHQFRGEASLGTWVYRITLNVCLREKAHQKKRAFVPWEAFHWETTAAPENSISNDQINQLHHCIKQLNESDRTVALLYLEEIPYRKIGEILGISENLVAVKMKRIRQKLYSCINQA